MIKIVLAIVFILMGHLLTACSHTPGDAAYRSGHYEEAADLYRKGAELGDSSAALRLGLMLADGTINEKEYGKATLWFEKACELGNLPGCHNVGVAYEYGKYDLIINYETAKLWYSKAAQKGYAQSQYNLASLYSNNYLTPQNDVEGYKWMLIAKETAKGCIEQPVCKWIIDDSPRHGQKLLDRMPFAQVEEAKRLAESWLKAK